MPPVRRSTPSMPQAVAPFPLPWAFCASVLLAAALPSTGLRAQGLPAPWPSALSAASPDTPVPSPVAPTVAPPRPTLPALASDPAQAQAQWQRANQRVAEFPRGHMDVLRWEQQHTPGATPPTTSTTPALTLATALRLSLRHRPELFTQPNMNALERAAVQRAHIDHVRQLQRAWTQAIASGQHLQLLTEVLQAAATGAELGERMVQTGNWSQAKLLREQQVQAQAWDARVQAQQDDRAARERLARLMGEWAADAADRLGAQLAGQLPVVPEALTPGEGLSATDVEAAVLRSDPTLAWQRTQTQRQLDAVGSGQLDAWRHAVDAAVATGTPHGPHTAPDIQDLPLLRDHLLARAVRAEANLLQRAAQRRSMAREAWAHLQAQHARALHAQNTVAHLGTQLEQETLTRYNGMLQSTWDLLASVRQRLLALDAAAQARRDFWLAQADWQALLAGGDYATGEASRTASSGAVTAPQGH